jgi:hypothetical protein
MLEADSVHGTLWFFQRFPFPYFTLRPRFLSVVSGRWNMQSSMGGQGTTTLTP